MAFEIERGLYGTVSLDGLGFIVLGFTPEAMGKGNWSVGLVADERASAEQRDAITAIASGAAGGPMAALSGLIGKFLGVQPAPIRFDRSGVKWSVKASDFVDMAAEGAKGHQPRCHRADAPRQHGPSGRGSLRVGARSKQPRACPRPGMGRRQRQEQRTVRAVLLAQRLARVVAAAATASVIESPSVHPSMPGPATRAERPPTIVESALQSDRAPAVVLLVLLPLICWMWIVVMARDMYGPMTGASAWMMTANWDVPHLLLLWAMWTVMMTGMMLPSASPLILLYGAIARRSAQGTAGRQIYALTAGYLIVWTRVQPWGNRASAWTCGAPGSCRR